jgi:SAM-dependent methyltransferase
VLLTARAASLFAGSSLFLLQPLVARALVPLYGGTSWVWIAVSVFFQLSLILGYVAATKLGAPGGRRLHARVAALALIFAFAGFWVLLRRTTFERLPIEFAVFLHLFLTVGAVAVYLAMASPLLQISIEADGRIDAHRLYAWSNAGSLAGLILYPTAMESFVPLRYQMVIWLTLATAAALLIHRTIAHTDASAGPQQMQWRFAGRTRVMYISAVAGALTIAVTTRLTLDLGALPLLWVLPLIVLLLSYIVAFGDWRPQHSVVAAAPMALIMALYLFIAGTVWLAPFAMVFLWCGLLFIIQCGLQTRLRALAPSGGARGAYYVALAFGGFVGSLVIGCLLPYYWNTVSLLAAEPLAAPVLRPILSTDPIPELSWCLVAAAFALVHPQRWRARDLIPGAVIGAVAMLLIASVFKSLAAGIVAMVVALAIAYLPAFAGWPSLFALEVTLLVAVVCFRPQDYTRELFRARSVYGVLIARETRDGSFTDLTHGTTVHGTQYSERNGAGEVVPKAPRSPLTYYHPGSPIGEIFKALAATECPLRVGIVGLGAGTLAAYARPGDHFEFYEIDPAVIAAAQGPHFSFVATARERGARISVVEGDGRQTLARRAGPQLDLLIIDAFSSDSIPAHLLTLEAFETARRQLAAGGHLAFHTSNRYFDVNRVVSANAAQLGWRHSVISRGRGGLGTSPSEWVIVRPADTLAPGACVVNLVADAKEGAAAKPVWTDDFSNPLRLLKAQGLWEQLTGNRQTREPELKPGSPATAAPSDLPQSQGR